MSVTEEQCKEIFDQFDADKSGEINARELVNAIAKCYELAGNPLSETDVKAAAADILSKADKNDDSKINYDEFKTEVMKA